MYSLPWPRTLTPFPLFGSLAILRKTQQKKAAAETAGEVIKLAVRLEEGINDALRTLIRYRGDLSAMAVEALETVDLSSVALISAERMVRDTTISMPVRLHKGIKKPAARRSGTA